LNYIEVTFTCDSAVTAELLLADLDALPVESVTQDGLTVKAYVVEEDYSDWSEAHFPLAKQVGHMTWTTTEIPHQNWNAEWESNFPPLVLGTKVLVKAPFHSEPNPLDFQHVIHMVPKMAFGTGHHPTTYLMMEAVLEAAEEGVLQGQKVLDMGCGTGILAVLAIQAGAANAVGIEIDPYAAENAQEIAEINGVSDRLKIFAGDAGTLVQEPGPYQWVLANINRNILLADLHHYASVSASGARLDLSGFYQADVETLVECAKRCGYSLVKQASREGWMRLTLVYQGHDHTRTA
jgi:ribosomal protein L11 methyltransferase